MKDIENSTELRKELIKINREFNQLKSSYDKVISDRKLAEATLVQQKDTLSKLNQFAIELSMLESEGSLEALILKRIREITGARMAMFSTYDEATRTTSTDHIEIPPGLLRKFISLVGRDKKLRFEVNDKMYAHLSKEVTGVRKTMHEISFGAIPRPVSAAIQALLQVDRFIGIAYLIEGKLYGTSLLGMTKDQPDPPKQILDSFVLLSSVALRRKQTEEALLRSYDLQDKLTAQVPGVVYQYRLYPDGRSAFPFSSPGMFDIYGVTPEQVREDATPVFSRLHPDDIDRIVEAINESARSNTLYHSEFRVILPGQGLRWRLCDAKPTRMEDGSTLWYGIISDITDRKMVEQELIEAKEKAEQSDRLKSAFLANISHEIRTPMNGILGFAELLKEPGLSGEEQKKYIRIIEKSGERMLNIINDIVDISKIESGQMEVVRSLTNLNEQIEFIYAFFKPEVERKGMQIIARTGLPEDQAIINTDREKIYAILTNFVKNAVKFTNQGSIEFGYEKKGTTLEFFVIDTGAGIPKDKHSIIFERFVQADGTDNRPFEGAGLGLAIAKAYVEMLGGEIRVESEPGKGSAFYFTIPYLTWYL